MKELDVLLEAFIEQNSAALHRGEYLGLEDFLQTEDDRLWDWIQGAETPDSAEFSELTRLIRDGKAR